MGKNNIIGPSGEQGLYGPNDLGYLDGGIRNAAKLLISCSELWSEGHYPHSNAKVMPKDHPIALALEILGNYDKEICQYANEKYNENLFKPYLPSIENQKRWNH